VLELRRHVPWLASGLAMLALLVPAAASAAPGAIKASDDVNLGFLFMDASQSNPLDNSVTVLPGEKVTFSYPEGGTSAHNVAFNDVGPQPTNCKQLTGLVIYPTAPPIAGSGLPSPWSGECVFPVAGTYGFFCSVHPFMTGTVVVEEASNTPPTVTAGRTPTGDVPRNTSVAFSATGSDADGDTLTYAWDFAARPPRSRTPTTSSTPPARTRSRSPCPTARAERARRPST
jgi:plastocyanin